MNILTQNGKMKKSSQNGIDLFNFGIPAFQSETGLKTCPNARQCATGCYARSGTYRFKNSVNAYEERLKLTLEPYFVDLMYTEIQAKALKSAVKGNKCIIRIHDAGDFYSKDYARKWIQVMNRCPEVRFYAYTKMVQEFKEYFETGLLPSNFRAIYSMGGGQDGLIQIEKDFHSKVFQNETDLLTAGYVNATDDDTIAAIGSSNRIGLVYHGVKGYNKTLWNKVA